MLFITADSLLKMLDIYLLFLLKRSLFDFSVTRVLINQDISTMEKLVLTISSLSSLSSLTSHNKSLPTSILENFAQKAARHRCHLTWLADHCVTASNGWCNFETQQVERQVPWADQASYTHGAFDCVVWGINTNLLWWAAALQLKKKKVCYCSIFILLFLLQ